MYTYTTWKTLPNVGDRKSCRVENIYFYNKHTFLLSELFLSINFSETRLYALQSHCINNLCAKHMVLVNWLFRAVVTIAYIFE